MALHVLPLALLLALPPLLSAQRAGQASSSRQKEPRTPDTCGMEGGWTTKVTFSSEQTQFRVNDTVLVTCTEDPEAEPFSANCTELRDRGAVWDISGVKCLRMCNSWAKQVDFDSAQPELDAGARVLVTCRQQFLRHSFNVTCRETESGHFEWDFGEHTCVKKCKTVKTWDSKLTFPPKGQFYAPGESVTLSCSKGYRPSPPVISCTGHGSQSVWSETPTCQGLCMTGAKDWPPSVSAATTQTEFTVGERVEVTCRQEQYEALTFHMQCVERDERATWDTSNVICVEKCQKPSWDASLHFEPDKSYYGRKESVTLRCPEGFEPSWPKISCVSRRGRNDWSGTASCLKMCKGPGSSDPKVRFILSQRFYSQGVSVRWSCPAGYRPSQPEIRCTSWGSWSGTATCTGICTTRAGNWPPSVSAASAQTEFAIGGTVWVRCRQEQYEGSLGWMLCAERAGRVEWDTSHVSCVEKCPRPQWDARLHFAPDRPFYRKNERMVLSCPGGSRPSSAEMTCVRQAENSVSRNVWAVQESQGVWRPLTENVTCLEMPRITPGDLEVSATTIKLRWTCHPPESCQGSWEIEARCWPERSLSDLCQRPAESREQMLQGVEGMLTCSSLQPFTLYSVDISMGYPATGLASSTLLYSQRVHTREAAPDGPEIEPLNLTTRTLSWKKLLPCKGVILGYQLNITAWRDYDSSFLEDESLRVNQSVTKYLMHHLSHGTNYTVTVQGLTAAGLGQASRWDFETDISGDAQTAHPGHMVIAMTVPLVLVLLLTGALLLLWFVLSRRKRDKREHNERKGAIPLKRNRGGASRLHTQIPVAELLETLKRFKRAEVEEEEATAEDDASPKQPPVGRNAEYQKLVSGLLHPCQVGKEPCNQSKNRYKSVIPYDHSRVVLQSAELGADYINASYVDSYRSPSFFIAAQGPLPGTVLDFWQMIWQEKVPAIVMLTGLVEQNKTKCEQYWPESEQAYGDLTVTASNTCTTTGLVVRTFRLQKASCPLPRHVEQFHYLLWPDHGIPSNPARLLHLVEMVNERVSETPAGPVLVHCSAGIGRTGTFIALDFLLKMARAEGSVDVFHCVQKLREQRVSMVQTKEQYAFLYEALLEGLLCGNTGVLVENIPSHVSHLRQPDAQTQSNGFTREFKALQQFSELFQLSPCREAQQPSNQPKNRKPAILPADCSRPILMSSLKADGSPGYINAVYVGTYAEEDRLIVTQLPLRETLEDFWALLWDYTCTSLVVLNRIQELDQTYPAFWPVQGEVSYGCFHVKLMSEEAGAGFTTRTLAATNRQQPNAAALSVRLWQVDDWPMQEHLPPRPATVISLLGEVERSQRLRQDSRVLVSCWDGASRCGIFCAAGFLCEQIRSEGLLDVSQAVRMLKRRRRQLVKDVEQYTFCYELALSYLDSFKIYGNFQ